MSKQLSNRLAALEQASKAPQTIFIRYAPCAKHPDKREPDEPEEAFIRRGRALSEGGIMFGQ